LAWRVIAHGDEVWHVDALAERRAHTEAWAERIRDRDLSRLLEERLS